MRELASRVALMTSLAAVSSCGGGSGVSVDQFPQAYAQAMCAQNFKCAPAADLVDKTMQQCVDNNSSLLFLLSASISDGQAKGRLSYDANQMGKCITAIKALTCDQWKAGLTMTSQPADCRTAVTAKVTSTGACLDDIECTTGHCEGDDNNASPPVMGTCTMLTAAGGACTANDECASDLYCDSTSHTCAAQRAGGQPCTDGPQCVNLSCTSSTGQCSSYAGCAVGGSPSGRNVAVSAIVTLWLAAVAIRRARRRRVGAISM